jgi:hypothetical protein
MNAGYPSVTTGKFYLVLAFASAFFSASAGMYENERMNGSTKRYYFSLIVAQ